MIVTMSIDNMDKHFDLSTKRVTVLNISKFYILTDKYLVRIVSSPSLNILFYEISRTECI